MFADGCPKSCTLIYHLGQMLLVDICIFLVPYKEAPYRLNEEPGGIFSSTKILIEGMH